MVRLPRTSATAHGSSAATATGADPRLHLVLLPPTEALTSGPAAVSFSFLAGAITALTDGGGGIGSQPQAGPRSSKLTMLLRDLLRPAPGGASRAAAAEVAEVAEAAVSSVHLRRRRVTPWNDPSMPSRR